MKRLHTVQFLHRLIKESEDSVNYLVLCNKTVFIITILEKDFLDENRTEIESEKKKTYNG